MNDTQEGRTTDPPPYEAFGARLAEWRQRAGIAQQADLALPLETSQQTVSRWESGHSRPRAKQIPALAKLLRIRPDELMAAAGYTAVVSFDKPFPVDGLTGESFERFCQSLLESLHQQEGATVHPVGGQGHDQEGADIEVAFPDGTRHSFQCKRLAQFGPAHVDKVVREHTRQAAKKIILLSRVASPKTRAAVELHGWDIWDKEDISRRVRSLSRETQVRLVDIFFPKQRFALLGETADHRWQTGKEFFAPYDAERSAFTHNWTLVGRSQQLAELRSKLADDQVQIILLTGAGGGGKSRILKTGVGEYEQDHRHVTVRYLSPTQDATAESLDELGQGEKLLIVDDAHDRSDLPLLFQHAAVPEKKTRLLLSFRPYGRDYIKSQASNFTLAGPSVHELELPPLKLADATELARQVLEKYNGPVSAAKDIARFTLDCPLATVIGAQVVAADRRPLELIKSEETFRSTLLGKFQDIVAGQIGNKSEADLVRKILGVLALVQPFWLEDQTIPQMVATLESVEAYDVSRIIRALIEAGVLFRRGGRYRLSPDLLADHIIEKACIGPEGVSTGYAEKVFGSVGEQYSPHVLLNLGKLDWRLANGDPSTSRLLDGLWSQLAPSRDYFDPHIKAITAVAYFQPDRALTFAENLVREGRHLRDLPEMIKYAAYTHDFTRRACECLWELGKDDDRDLNPNPNHAIRILSELCAVEPNKPLEYNEAIVDFALSLLDQPDAWTHKYSPIDILRGILHPEGHTTQSHGKSFSITRFGVNPDVVSALRTRVIDAVISTLASPNLRAAGLAAQSLHEALRYPMDATIEARDKWTTEFVQTLSKIERAMRESITDSLVLIEAAQAVSWHAHYGLDDTAKIARGILDSLPDTLDFRAMLALIDGHGHIIERYTDYEQHQKRWNEYLDRLVTDLLRAYAEGEALRAFIARSVSHIRTHYARTSSTPYLLYWRLIAASLPLARATLDDALLNADSATRPFANMALAKLIQKNRREGVEYAKKFIETGSPDLEASIGSAFSLLTPDDLPLAEEEITILRRLLGSQNRRVAHSAVSAIRVVAKGNHALRIDLLKAVNIGLSADLADDVFEQFASEQGELFRALTAEDVRLFLVGLMPIAELDGHWIESFLAAVSESFAPDLARFFMDRVDHAADTGDWDYRPCNYGPYGHVPLRFRKSSEYVAVLRAVSPWMTSRDDLLFRERSAQLFDTMFKPFDAELVTTLQRWADAATEADMRAIAKILGEAPRMFVFDHRAFVVQFLDRAKQFGKPVLDLATAELFGSSISGLRSSSLGQPTPADLQMKQGAEKATAELPRFAPAFALYDSILRHANWSIDRSIRDGEAFEE
jgi:transcriptional regulator with XRE-family HTH domain